MNIILLLGSGISLDSGIPNVKEITKEVIEGKWHRHTDELFYQGEKPSDNISNIDNTCPYVHNIQLFLKVLLKQYQEYLKDIPEREVNYEDLYYLCKQINQDDTYTVLNPAIKEFIDKLEEIMKPLIKPNPRLFEELTVIKLSRYSCNFIHCVVWNLLSNNPPPQNMEFIKLINADKDIDHIDIGTLNHDTLVEDYCKENAIKLIDGFGCEDNNVRICDLTTYNNTKKKIRLYKLHGSINWYSIHDKRTDTNTIGIFPKGINIDRFPENENLSPVYNVPMLLIGSYNKLFSYGLGSILWFMNRFENKLLESNRMIVSGYGWGDHGINQRIISWLEYSKDNKIILLHKEYCNLICGMGNNIREVFLRFRIDNKIVIMNKWMGEITEELYLKVKEIL